MKCVVFGLLNQGKLLNILIHSCRVQSGIDLTAYLQSDEQKNGGGHKYHSMASQCQY